MGQVVRVFGLFKTRTANLFALIGCVLFPGGLSRPATKSTAVRIRPDFVGTVALWPLTGRLGRAFSQRDADETVMVDENDPCILECRSES